LHQQRVPRTVAFFPVLSRKMNGHRSLRPIGDVVSLPGSAKVAASTEVENEVLHRVEKVPSSRLDPRLCLFWRTRSQRRLHAYQNVLDRTFWLGTREKYVAVSLREYLHPLFKRSVIGLKSFS